MPGRRNGSTEASGPSHLLVSVADAKSKLVERIEGAGELHSIPIRSEEDLKAVRHRYYTWDEYNEALLRRLFSGEYELNKYHGLYGAVPHALIGRQIELLHDRIAGQRRKLESLAQQLELYESVPAAAESGTQTQVFEGNEVFIVHGRDEHLKEAAARLVSTLGLEPIILHEQVNLGRTIIQKFMDHAKKTVYAIVLLTPDDVGRLANDANGELKPRARQNVIMELGFFLGVLGPGRVCALQVGNVEIPSDFSGVMYIAYDAAGAWRFQVAKEMHAAGISVETNRLLGKQ